MKTVYCVECGEEIREDDSPGVWLHTGDDGPDIDMQHVAVPDTDDYGQ